ncbi:MAG: universal stress protein [Bacteroidota bacterium]|nr:universal stress protein [Bacteroidota bacterium]
MKLMFATDLSEPKQVTDQVQRMTRRLDAELFVLHVHVPTPTTPLGVDPLSGFGDIAYALYDPAVENAIVEAEQYDFDAFILERFDIPVRPALHEGDPARIILDDAERMDTDMIMLAKRRHSAIERMLLGSVTNTVAKEAKQPVLLVPIHETDN